MGKVREKREQLRDGEGYCSSIYAYVYVYVHVYVHVHVCGAEG